MRSILVLTALFAAAPALAQTPTAPAVDPDTASRVVDDLAACRGIPDNNQRLACYDRTAAALVAARDRRDIVVVDRQEVRRTRRSLFGFTLPRIRLFGNDNDDPNSGVDRPADRVDEITSKIARLRRIDLNRYVLTLEDGSIWEMSEGSRGAPPNVGDTIRIRAGSLGSYIARIRSEPQIRVRRVG